MLVGSHARAAPTPEQRLAHACAMFETRPLCPGQSFRSGRLAGAVRTFPPGRPPCPKLSVRALPPEPNPQDSLGMVVPRGVNSAGLPCRCWLYLCARGAGVGFRCVRVAGKTVCAFGVSCTQKKVDFCVLSKLSVPLGPRAPYCPVRSCPYLPSPAPPAVRWTVRTFKIGVSNIAVNWLSTQLAPQN